MKNKNFTEEHELFRATLQKFLNKEVAPNIDTWEKEEKVPREIIKKMGEMGYLGLNYPEKYGGMNLDFFYSVVFMEEICKLYSGGFAITLEVIQYMSSPYIYKHGSDFLKEKYLKNIISGDIVSSIAITEPGAGSDVANIKTTAISNGDYYIVNGSKTFITNGLYGNIYIAVVKTNPKAGVKGVSLLIIDKNTEGITTCKINKLGWHSSDTAEISFDNVKVPKENLIGEEGLGFIYLMGGLQLERLSGAIMAIAGAKSALNYGMEYANQREAFGRKINHFQVLRHRIAQMTADIEVVSNYVYYCSELHNEGKYAVKECSIAKLQSTELASRVVNDSLQLFGGYGFTEDFKIARMYRDARIGTIGGGTSEIMREIIAKMVIDDVTYSYSTDSKDSTNKDSNSSDKLFEIIKKNAEKSTVLNKTLRLDIDDTHIYIDGTNTKNEVSKSNADADCVITINKDDFKLLLLGNLNPMQAVMSGKIKIEGDIEVAMKLQSLL